jgi:hypothetical protein
MGILDFLTKPIKLTSAAFSWQEPWYYRLRLRGDLLARFGVLLAAWAVGIGVMLVVFAFNSDPPGIGLAIGLGLLGLAPAFLLLFARGGHVSGRIDVYQGDLRRQRTVGGLMIRGEWTKWPYEVISQCIFVPGQAIGKPFSVMLLSVYDDWEIIGIPQRIDLRQLASYLQQRGVQVSSGQAIPVQFRSGLNVVAAAVAPLVGLLVLCGGVVVYSIKVSGKGEETPRVATFDRSQFDVDIPAVPRSGSSNSESAGRPGSLPPRPPTGQPPGAAPSASETSDTPPSPTPPVPQPPRIPGFSPRFPQSQPSPFTGRPPAFPPQPSSSAVPQDFPPPAAVAPSGTRTQVVGTTSGIPFTSASPQQQTMIGVRYALGAWAGKDGVAMMIPLFEGVDRPESGDFIFARDGYAVGAIQVDATDFVHAACVVFMRITPAGGLEASDSYTSDWIGTRYDNPVQTVSGEGQPVIGIHGYRAGLVNAIGLVTKGSRSPNSEKSHGVPEDGSRRTPSE